jgi:hypothetical protein
MLVVNVASDYASRSYCLSLGCDLYDSFKRGRVFTKRERERIWMQRLKTKTLPFPFFSLELHQSCASGLIHKTTRKKRVDPQDT